MKCLSSYFLRFNSFIISILCGCCDDVGCTMPKLYVTHVPTVYSLFRVLQNRTVVHPTKTFKGKILISFWQSLRALYLSKISIRGKSWMNILHCTELINRHWNEVVYQLLQQVLIRENSLHFIPLKTWMEPFMKTRVLWFCEHIMLCTF